MPVELQILTQVLGAVAMTLGVLSFQAKSNGKILTWQVTANFFWCAHFFLLNAYTGAILNVLALVRNATYFFLNKKETDKTTQVAIGFCALSIVLSLITYQSALSILPMLGTAVQSFSFAAKSANKMRLFTLIGSPFWLSYNLLSGSLSGTATEVFAMISMIVGMIRYRNKIEIVDRTKEEKNGSLKA